MSMLYLELYKHRTKESVVWNLGEPQSENLLSPSIKLHEAWSTQNVKYHGNTD